MGKVAELAAKLRALTPTKVEALALEVIEKHAADFIKLNEEQLFEGKTAKGTDIKPPYASDSYANYKLKYNPLGVVDLFLTGSFYGSFFLYASQFPIFVFATDEKTNKLVDKYGADIFGLTKEHIKQVSRENILPDFGKAIREAIRL